MSYWIPYCFWHFYSVGAQPDANTIVSILAVAVGHAIILAVAC